eukprot:6063849-Prymnesium_polylepis.1
MSRRSGTCTCTTILVQRHERSAANMPAAARATETKRRVPRPPERDRGWSGPYIPEVCVNGSFA